MRSVYTKVLLWSFGTLVFSLAALFAIGFFVARRDIRGSLPFRVNMYLLDEAIEAYESGGAAKAAPLLKKQGLYFRLELHLTNAAGKDLVTGEDRSAAIPKVGEPPRKVGGRLVFAMPDRSGRYRLVVYLPEAPFDMRPMIPYYILILLAVAGLCWLLAVNIAAPLRQLSRTVERFGAGDLDARVRLRRRDELGELAGAFNQMADRIQTLLNAERRLLQDISHELRSPLARLSFAAELTRTATDRNAAVARLRKEIDRLADLISGLIQVTRAEGEFPERNLEELSVNELVQEVCSSCELEAAARRCKIEAASSGDVTLRGDPELLRRAVENVVRNAIRYSPEESAVVVNVERNGASASISVRDHGPGVPEEMLAKIFTPFFRVDSSRDTATGGVGLGLAIAQRAVLLHHGAISADNENPGLRVTITLPLASAPA
ncbi:MAG: HAMP domain-containing protein [Acidobacteria bacterium]|nr:HAMP domain-containing protein [Acidobacteriota bacterium]